MLLIQIRRDKYFCALSALLIYPSSAYYLPLNLLGLVPSTSFFLCSKIIISRSPHLRRILPFRLTWLFILAFHCTANRASSTLYFCWKGAISYKVNLSSAGFLRQELFSASVAESVFMKPWQIFAELTRHLPIFILFSGLLIFTLAFSGILCSKRFQ